MLGRIEFGLKKNLSQKEFENKNIMDSKHLAVQKNSGK